MQLPGVLPKLRRQAFVAAHEDVQDDLAHAHAGGGGGGGVGVCEGEGAVLGGVCGVWCVGGWGGVDTYGAYLRLPTLLFLALLPLMRPSTECFL